MDSSLSRRTLLGAVPLLFAAPAIVRASSLMHISPVRPNFAVGDRWIGPTGYHIWNGVTWQKVDHSALITDEKFGRYPRTYRVYFDSPKQSSIVNLSYGGLVVGRK